MKKSGSWNPARVFDALGRIGYNPVSALLDMCDNSVSADATKVRISINLAPKPSNGSGKTKAIIDSFQVADNGKGMDEEGLHNALTFGSSESFYTEGTLSKFGLGLKSAASSLGRKLEIISRGNDGITRIATLDRDQLMQDYEYELREANDGEKSLLDQHAGSAGHTGTIIQISKIRLESMPSPTEIKNRLNARAGVIFFFHLHKNDTDGKQALQIFVDDEPVKPIDPLFRAEISKDDDELDEASWDGLSVKWILKPQSIQLDNEGSISGTVSVVQLPHPPSVANSGSMTQAACREKYMIGAGNYGVYIYRNGRLISWADNLDGMINQDQDLYSFRGSLELKSDSDDILNLDVTKSRIHLSEIAKSQLTAKISEAKKNSIKAWDAAKTCLNRKLGEEPRDTINEQIDSVRKIIENDEKLDEKVAPPEEKKKLEKRRIQAIETTPATPEEESKLRERAERVQYVDSLPDNQLWQRALAADGSLIVRVNRSHRMIRDVVDVLHSNKQLVMTLDLFMFSLASAEYKLVYNGSYEERIIEKIMESFRGQVGDELSNVLRKMDLPVITGS